MSNFNLNNNHPLIENSNEYLFEKKYVSINSDDRNVIKYPNPAEFEIELPQDYVNVQTVKLVQWAFPSNYDVFSLTYANLNLYFKMTSIYDPSANGVTDVLQKLINKALLANINYVYSVTIEPGFYNPIQMATELTNRMNYVMTTYLKIFLTKYYPSYLSSFTGYTQFVVTYDSVGQRLWFGNKSSGFTIINDPAKLEDLKVTAATGLGSAGTCIRKQQLPSYSNWGLASFLGFTRCDGISQPRAVPRFYYADDITQNSGYWLVPDLSGAIVQYLATPAKINFKGPSYYYLEIEGLNCIDETSPYNPSPYTTNTNGTNGRINSCFAKIPVVTTPIAQFYDREAIAYKWFNPPAERIRRLKIKVRNHDGSVVQFGNFDFSIMLQFGLLKPQQKRVMDITVNYGV